MHSNVFLSLFAASLVTPVAFAQSTRESRRTTQKPTIVVQQTTQQISTPVGSNAKKLSIKQRQATINALLIREITSGNYGASVSKLTASVLPEGHEQSPMITQMNQSVGSSMIKSFGEVNKGIYLKHNAWPKGEKLTLGFADKHGGKDGPSAALAYSLLLESLITGHKLRGDVACTGDMNSDRSVQPIGGVMDKIRAAKKAGCAYVLIPAKNVPSVIDAAIDGDIDLITSIQIISVENLNQASKIAFKGLDKEATEALAAYEKVQQSIEANGIAALRDKNVFKNVAITGKALSNHQSAIIAAKYKLNILPQTYSVLGSFERLSEAMAPFMEKDHSRGSVEKYNTRNDAHKEAMKNLSRISGKLHPKMKKFAKAAKNYISAHREIVAKKNGVNPKGYLYTKFTKALKAVQDEEKAMLLEPEIKDSLAQ